MKRIFTFSAFIVVILLLNCCTSSRHISVKGDKEIVEKKYQFEDFNKIESVIPYLIEYVQSSETPTVVVKTDNNIQEYIEIKVKNNTLHIGLTDNRGNLSIQPTVFIVYVNSTTLIGASVIGSGKLNINSNLSAKKLSFDVTGSGDIIIPHIEGDKATFSVVGSGSINNASCKVSEMKMTISGSGKISSNNINSSAINAQLAGSGRIFLSGVTQKKALELVGSGSIQAENLTAAISSCSIAGSGIIKANAIETLSGNLSGSGKMYYKGNPKVAVEIVGSGKLIPL